MKIFSATLKPTGTVNAGGEYCEYQYCEAEEEEYGEEWNGETRAYVENLIDIADDGENYKIVDNVTVHNCPKNAIVIAYDDTPRQMFWAAK